jgi:hypothetical protein
MSTLPQYLQDRLVRPLPHDCHVAQRTTPVVSFGDPSAARIATLGLNPSHWEFIPVNRFAPPESNPEQILAGCNGYFHNNPYRAWFDKLAPCLTAFNASYYDGTACHLDLVQWATKQSWGKLRSAEKRHLLAEDVPFLAEQLHNNKSIGLLLVNGSGVWKHLCEALPVDETREFTERITGHTMHPVRVRAGVLWGRIRILAWSTNIQSAHGVKKTFWSEVLPTNLRAVHDAHWRDS